MFIAGLVKKRLSFAIFFSYYFFFHLVVEVYHSPYHLSKRALLICKLRMRRMIENDTDLLKFYTRKAGMGRAPTPSCYWASF